MKSLIFSIVTICLISSLSFSQSACSKYYPLEEGTTFQYTNYNKKGKVSSVINHSVTNNRTENGNEVVTMTTKMHDKKGELIIESAHDITCTGDGVSIDFESLANSQMFSQFENFEYEITGTNLELPNNLYVGLELSDATMNMKISVGITMNMVITIKDRKVIGEETITTPAGTFDCYVLTSTLDMDMMMKIEGSSKQWIAEGYGMVKQESFDNKGNLTGYSELTEFNK